MPDLATGNAPRSNEQRYMLRLGAFAMADAVKGREGLSGLLSGIEDLVKAGGGELEIGEILSDPDGARITELIIRNYSGEFPLAEIQRILEQGFK
jgi:hypothetical protein